MRETKDDVELLDEARAGRLGSFDDFMKRHERMVFCIAYGYTKNRESALDLCQSVFLKSFRGLATYRGEASPRTWLSRIASHESIDWLRRQRHEQPFDELPEAHARAVSAPTQEKEIEAKQRATLVQEAMAELNERYRLAVSLRYEQGLGIEEISSILGCSQGVTKNILFRSVRSLRQSLAGTA